MDLPGFGGSEGLPEATTLPGLATAVVDFLDELGVTEPVRVAGNSLGGAVAMQLAVQARERVDSLLLVNSAGFGQEVTPALRILAIRPLGKAMLARPSLSGATRFERAIFHDPSFVTTARIERTLRLASRPGGADAMLEILQSLGSMRGVLEPWRRELLVKVATLDLPLFVVWGDNDRILPAKHLDAARAAFPKARTRLFAATGHMPQIERAEALGGTTTGAHDYVLRFEKGQEPAADAFWSLTMYDEHGFQVPNPLGRFVLRDRDDLVRGPDGSLELYVQHSSPGTDREANWLPAPKGPFAVMVRIYSPAPQLLRSGVHLPALRKVR